MKKEKNPRIIEHAICEELKKMFAVDNLRDVWGELATQYGINNYGKKTKELFG